MIIEMKLEKIFREAEDKIQSLADTYREEVMIPACKRAKMTFLVINGLPRFSPIKQTKNKLYHDIQSTDQAIEDNKSYLVPIIETIWLSITLNNTFF